MTSIGYVWCKIVPLNRESRARAVRRAGKRSLRRAPGREAAEKLKRNQIEQRVGMALSFVYHGAGSEGWSADGFTRIG